jgi:tRNA/tmRNA/rRNA uracil-C5-methylase (TrmA/RlmC/RlmD family)
VIWKDKKACLAYHIPESRNKFIIIDSCSLVSKNMNDFLASFIEIVNKENLASIKEIEVRESYSDKSLLFTVYPIEKHGNKLDKLSPQFNLKNTYIEETVSGKTFRIGPDSFFQINVPMLESVLKEMRKSISPDKKEILADLYCGIGTFGICLSQYVKEVIALESFQGNISFLKGNLKLNKIENFKVYEGSCEKIFPSLMTGRIDILIVDPPRKGMDNMLCQNIIMSSVKKILYLSCNPATLSRDLKILSSSYSVKTLHLFDFFPQTPHIETLAILEKK